MPKREADEVKSLRKEMADQNIGGQNVWTEEALLEAAVDRGALEENGVTTREEEKASRTDLRKANRELSQLYESRRPVKEMPGSTGEASPVIRIDPTSDMAQEIAAKYGAKLSSRYKGSTGHSKLPLSSGEGPSPDENF